MARQPRPENYGLSTVSGVSLVVLGTLDAFALRTNTVLMVIDILIGVAGLCLVAWYFPRWRRHRAGKDRPPRA